MQLREEACKKKFRASTRFDPVKKPVKKPDKELSGFLYLIHKDGTLINRKIHYELQKLVSFTG